MDSTAGWSIDAGLAIAPLERRGWAVDWVPWRRTGVDWSRYAAVYIGVPWDYPQDPEGFLGVLEAIAASPAVLVNDLSLVRWNLAKTYLRDLEARGAAIVPSQWFDRFDSVPVDQWFERAGSGRIVAKPVVGTNAEDAFVLERGRCAGLVPRLATAFADRPFLVQPFINGVVSEGEYSLFYLGGALSHAILKTPAAGDFRVQEEHGAAIVPVRPEPALVDAGERALRAVSPLPVYARCDLVRGPDGRFLLMELELIEPSLYLRMDPAAPERFANAFDDHVRSTAPGGQTRFP